MVQSLRDCPLFVGGFHYKALDNKSMVKHKWNLMLEGGEKVANDIRNVNVWGEGNYSPRSVYQS
jgi:hypothetical protein